MHLKPSSADGPSITLFTRDLLLAYKDIDEPVFNAVQKHFVQHSSQWLNPKNIALSVYAEVPTFTLEAVKEKTFPKQINIEQRLWKRGTLRDFFTEGSKMAPCITSVSVLLTFWRNIDNNNRGVERFVGKLKGVVNGLTRDDKDNLNKTDMRILATLHNVV